MAPPARAPAERADARARGVPRSSGRSTHACSAEPGCSSACPLLARGVHGRPAAAAARPALPPTFDGATARGARAATSRDSIRTAARVARSPRRRAVVPGPAAAVRLHSRRTDRSRRRSPDAATCSCATSSRSLRALPAGDRRHGAPRQRRHGPGANDNASGTAALVELARGLRRATASAAGRRDGRRTRLVFVSTDGGAYGALGAAQFAERSPLAADVVAVISLDAIAGRGRAPPPARRRPAALARARARRRPRRRVLEETGERAARTERAATAVRPRLPVQRSASRAPSSPAAYPPSRSPPSASAPAGFRDTDALDVGAARTSSGGRRRAWSGRSTGGSSSTRPRRATSISAAGSCRGGRSSSS